MKRINRPNQIFRPKKKNLGSYIYQDSHGLTMGGGMPTIIASRQGVMVTFGNTNDSKSVLQTKPGGTEIDTNGIIKLNADSIIFEPGVLKPNALSISKETAELKKEVAELQQEVQLLKKELKQYVIDIADLQGRLMDHLIKVDGK